MWSVQGWWNETSTTMGEDTAQEIRMHGSGMIVMVQEVIQAKKDVEIV